MTTNEEGRELLNELIRLSSISRTNDFDLHVDIEKLPGEEKEYALLLKQILKNCKSAVEYDLIKYQLTNDALGIALWDMDIVHSDPINPNNKFTWSNEFRQMLGFTDENEFPNILSSWADRIHPDDKERVLGGFVKHIADITAKTTYNLEYRLMTKSGEYRSFRAVGLTMRDENGAALKVAGALEDITDRVQQQEMLENILNTMDSYIYTTDIESDEILFANQKMIADFHLSENTKGDKCWRYFQQSQTRRCAWCKKAELLQHPDKSVIWEENNPISGNSLYKIDRIIDWPGGNKVHMQQGFDITAIKQAQEALHQREKILDTLNQAAIAILSRQDDAFEEAMTGGIRLIAGIADFDRMSIFRNVKKPDGLHFSQVYRWTKASGGSTPTLAALTDAAYAELIPRWEAMLASGEIINGVVPEMPEIQSLQRFGCETVLAVPIVNDGEFWGFVFFENLQKGSSFSAQESDLLRSASFMLANVVIRSEESQKLHEADEYVRLMLDATPLASRLWSRDFELLECNEAAVKLFGLKNKQEYLDRYFELSPEYQPDGHSTRDKIKEVVAEAFETGGCTFEWMYLTDDGTLIPAEITMVRVPYRDDYVVASYSRDLREYKKMMSEIEHRDNLLRVGNQTSFILFDPADDKEIEEVLSESMELLGKCINADYVHILQNEMIGDVLHFTFKYAWNNSQTTAKTLGVIGLKFPYSVMPDWEEKFLQGVCLNGPIKNFSIRLQEFYDSFPQTIIKSVLAIPIFVRGEFWGLASFADCKHERFFGEDEVSMLRSMSLMMATAVNRNTQAVSLREAHSRFKLLANATPLGFNLWNRKLQNTATNDTAVKLFGLQSQGEYLEKFFDLSHDYQPDGSPSKEKTLQLIKETFEEGYRRFEWLHHTSDGTPIPAEIILVRIPYGDDYVVAGYTRDLREHKKMLAEIERRDKLLQAVNQMADMLLQSDPDHFSETLKECMGMMTRIINADRMYISKNYKENGKLYRTQLYEWAETSPSFQGTELVMNIPYDDLDIQAALERGECVSRLVKDMISVDRERLTKQGIRSLLLVPVFIRSEFWGFVGFDNCRSEKMFSENEEFIMHSGSLLIVNALLRNESMISIREASGKLERALQDAENANNAKSGFLAHMSHEIRTPLNAVIGLSELMIGEGHLNDEDETNMEKIYGAGATILSIVNDILDISKIESGKFEIYPVQYDTPSLINDVITLNIVRIGEKPVKFSLFIDEHLPASLFGDDLRVKQIFNNLLSNAFKYTHAGTVEWHLSCERRGNDVWLFSRIQDTGIGIKPEDIKKLFTDYNQLNMKTNRSVQGTGLGLAITKRLVEMMGGMITVESEYRKGTTFHVRLCQAFVSDRPIGKETAQNLMGLRYTLSRRSKNTQRSRSDLSYAHILIVDDIITNLDVAKGIMKPYGMKIDCADSGPMAIEMIRWGTPRYSAIFMDHMMPGMDGIEATRIIREEIGTDYARNIPIIALTANAVLGNEEMFLAKGFQAFISKPIDLAKLDSVLRQWVRDKKLEHNVDEYGGETNAAGDTKTDPMDALLKIDGLEIQIALERFGGDESILFDVLRSYLNNTGSLLTQSRKHLESENATDYAIIIHGIKGTSYAIGAQVIGQTAEFLEKASKSGGRDTVKKGHAALEKMIQSLLKEIENALGTQNK